MISRLATSGKILFILLLLTLLSEGTFAQKREIGGGIGPMFYTGDLGRGIKFSNIGMAGTVLYRTNINDFISIRVSFLGGNLKGSDAKPVDAFAAARAASFNIFVSEFAGTFEYYFLNFRGTFSNCH